MHRKLMFGFAVAMFSLTACHGSVTDPTPEGVPHMPANGGVDSTTGQQQVLGDTMIYKASIQTLPALTKVVFGKNGIALANGHDVVRYTIASNADGSPMLMKQGNQLFVSNINAPLAVCDDRLLAGNGILTESFNFASGTKVILNGANQINKSSATSYAFNPTDCNNVIISDSSRVTYAYSFTSNTVTKTFADPTSQKGGETFASFNSAGDYFTIGGVTSGTNGIGLQWYSTNNGLMPQTFPQFGHRGSIKSVDWQGKHVVTTGSDSTAKVWDVSDPTRPRLGWSIAGLKSIPLSGTSTADGKFVAIGFADGSVNVYQMGQLMNLVWTSNNTLHKGGVIGLQFSADGKHLLSFGGDGVVKFMDRVRVTT